MDTKAQETIKKRQSQEKQLVIEQLRKNPIIQIACEKLNISRASFYRWKSEDKKFENQVEEAIKEGNSLINDVAESQLMSLIRDQNLSAVIFWLKHHHPSYGTKVEVTARLKADNEVLTPEQEALITKALKLASLLPEGEEEKQNDI